MSVVYYDVTPSSTSGLAVNDVIFTATSMANTGGGYLDSVACWSLDDQDDALDLYFLRSSVAVGAANAAFAPSDANVDEIITKVSFTTGSGWSDANTSRYQIKTAAASDAGMGVYMSNVASATNPLIYLVGVMRTTGGWSSGGLKFRIGLAS